MYAEIDCPNISNLDETGMLRAVDLQSCPFKVKRVFTVAVNKRQSRGGHAHRLCNQLLICTMGSIDLELDDGHERQTITLPHSAKGIVIPAGVWAEQHYAESFSAILVLCDRLYEEEDYIRDYKEFIEFVKTKNMQQSVHTS